MKSLSHTRWEWPELPPCFFPLGISLMQCAISRTYVAAICARHPLKPQSLRFGRGWNDGPLIAECSLRLRSGLFESSNRGIRRHAPHRIDPPEAGSSYPKQFRESRVKNKSQFRVILAACIIGGTFHQTDAGAMMGGCMTGCTGTTIIDPPRGSAFADPVTMPNRSTTPSVVEVNVEAKIAPINVNGFTANLQTYNGYYPAPTIKVKKGDLLKVHFKNSLPYTGTNSMGMPRDMTNLHTHGFHVSPAGNSDNMLLHFMTGETFDYEYDLSLHPGGNLNWYHPHQHGNAAERVWAGLAGAIEVADENTTLASFETHTMVLKDISLSNGAPAAHTSSDFMNGKEGDTMMVNGKVNPVLTMKPGQVQRWRIVNASNARFYKLSLANHSLHVIGTDGGLLDKPYPQSTVLLSPGERVDVLVKPSTTKAYYKLKALAYNRGAGASANRRRRSESGGKWPIEKRIAMSVQTRVLS